MEVKLSHILLIALLIVGYLWYTGQLQLPFVVQQPPTTGEELVSVMKPVQFYVLDPYAGGARGGVTLSVYDQSMALLEILSTGADGLATTSAAYKSGTVFNVKATVTGAYEKMWYSVVVPKMSRADAESLTVNGPISLKLFDYTAPTIDVRDSNGNTYTDGSTYNKSARGSTPIFTVTWYQPTDNHGYMASHDPINNVDWKALLVVKVSGTGYENVVVQGFPNSIERGNAMYYCIEINPETLTKWKVGNDYKLPGTGSFTFSLDLSGYNAATADMDIYIYYYADWNNFVAKGSFGPDSLSVLSNAPHTINLVV